MAASNDLADLSPWARVLEAVHEARESDEALRSAHRESLEEMAALKAKFSLAADDAEATRADLHECTSAARRREAAAASAEEDLATLRDRIQLLERQAEERDAETAAALRSTRHAQSQVEELLQRLARREAAVDSLQQALGERDEALRSVRDEARALKEALVAAKSDGERRGAANETLRARVAEREARLAEIQRRTHEAAPLADRCNQQPEAGPAAGPAARAGAGGTAAHVATFARRVLSATRADRSGQALEELARRLFLAEGYAVPPRRSGANDGGIDIWMHTPDDVAAVVQCKSKASAVSVAVGDVRAFVGSMDVTKVDSGFFVTNQAFTHEARELALALRAATSKRLELYAADELTVLISQHVEKLQGDHFVAALLESSAQPAAGGTPGSSGSAARRREAAAVLQRAARRRSSIGAGGITTPSPAAARPRPSPSSTSSAAASPTPPGAAKTRSPSGQGRRAGSPVGPGRATPRSATGAARQTRNPWSGEEDALLIRLFHTLRFHECVGEACVAIAPRPADAGGHFRVGTRARLAGRGSCCSITRGSRTRESSIPPGTRSRLRTRRGTWGSSTRRAPLKRSSLPAKPSSPPRALQRPRGTRRPPPSPPSRRTRRGTAPPRRHRTRRGRRRRSRRRRRRARHLSRARA